VLTRLVGFRFHRKKKEVQCLQLSAGRNGIDGDKKLWLEFRIQPVAGSSLANPLAPVSIPGSYRTVPGPVTGTYTVDYGMGFHCIVAVLMTRD
jgi:hypothetical protein